MRLRFGVFASFLFVLAGVVDAKPLERVPEDGSLQQALQRVSPGGTIDVAAGVYAAPPNGFRARNKSLTIRARDGAEVVLDGAGASAIFLVEDQGVDTGRTVAFEGITFRDGLTTDTRRGGAVTVDAAYATFTSCVFEDNAAEGPQARGGAVQVLDAGVARFVNTRFTDNRAVQWGAAIYAIEESKVNVVWSEFTGNRTDLPGQGPVPAGGAIYLLNAQAIVTGTRFENNRSGWVGGALYALGNFRNPVDEPSALLVVENSTFIDNHASPNACCDVPGPATGGAIHVEDQATLEVRDSRFLENRANWGGAISGYRAIIHVADSVFRGNRAQPLRGTLGAGGTFNVGSADFADGSTDGGAVNRRVAELHVTDSLVQGRFGATTEPTAQQGGCVFVSGDGNRLNGTGVPQDGTAADNRAIVTLTRVALLDCDAESSPEGRALGGGVHVNLADVTFDGSIVADSDALGDTASGGAFIGLAESVLRAFGTAFANNTAEERGAGVQMVGGEVEIRDSLFLDNDVSPGEAEEVQRSPGAALALGPGDDDITGVVESSTFSGNVGMPIVDIDSDTPPFNEVVYNGNTIHSTTFGNEVYRNLAVGAGGLTVAELNDLVIRRTGGATTSKSEVDNTFRGSAPRVGELVAAPSRVLSSATPGEDAPTPAFLAYAWTGAGAATVGGADLASHTGLEVVDDDRRYRLEVGGQEVDREIVSAAGCSTEDVHCLNGERFLVEVYWRDFAGNVGDGQAVLGGADDSGLFWFFDEDNWEMLVKVLNGCAITDRFWVFAAATTNVEYTLRVTDRLTGVTQSYFNPLGNAAVAITDTDALDVCDAKSLAAPRAVKRSVGPGPMKILEGKGACAASAIELCLNDSRFRLEVDWRDFNGNSGSGQVVPFGSNDSGLFFFFTEDNWEMLVKVLTGCGINQHYWVFAAATTNVEYTLRVVDTETGETKSYFNRLGNAAAAITDTEAFATCP